MIVYFNVLSPSMKDMFDRSPNSKLYAFQGDSLLRYPYNLYRSLVGAL
jgi:hypothetical protein